MKIRTKRVYADPSDGDGARILVDRLWPRGLTKEAARIDYWAKSIAPSNELRRWYHHNPEKWPEFQRRYAAELDANPEGISALRARLSRGVATLLFSSRELERNNATALKDYLEAGGAA